ncbi:Pex12 amino terminal region-domain-containing protein, partial [Lipomyces japonicus]|uniref:Pex12 amino terminal region-domain-containing protein n=1 Tax=Lipomyces japonicus TaxID=56871 RepID=UPI0034CDE5CF
MPDEGVNTRFRRFGVSTVSGSPLSIVQGLLTSLSMHQVPPMRVGQLDASLLDHDLVDILKGQILDSIKFFNSSWRDKYEAEIFLFLKVLLWKVTVWDYSATYGGLLQNLRIIDARSAKLSKGLFHSPSRLQKIGLGFFVIFGDYLWQKILNFADNEEQEHSTSLFSRRWQRLLHKADATYETLSFLNFIAFLYNGKYPTLVYRLFRLRLVSSSRSLSREVSFEFLNRQLVWDEFTKFLLFVIPMLHLPKLKRKLGKLVGNSKNVSDITVSFSFLPERTCAICYEQDKDTSPQPPAISSLNFAPNSITNPYSAVECGHIYCYVCLVTQLEEQEGEGWNCLRCGKLVKNATPWVDVQHEQDEVESDDSGESIVDVDDVIHVRDEEDDESEPDDKSYIKRNTGSLSNDEESDNSDSGGTVIY